MLIQPKTIFKGRMTRKIICRINLNNVMVSFKKNICIWRQDSNFLIKESHLSVNHDVKKLYARRKSCSNHTSTISCVQLSKKVLTCYYWENCFDNKPLCISTSNSKSAYQSAFFLEVAGKSRQKVCTIL